MAAQKVLCDAIVIGAGIQGCFTAYHLAKHRKKVILLEQVLCLLHTPDFRDCPSLLFQREVSRASTLWGEPFLPKGYKNTDLKRYMHSGVYSSIINSSQTMERAQVSID